MKTSCFILTVLLCTTLQQGNCTPLKERSDKKESATHIAAALPSAPMQPAVQHLTVGPLNITGLSDELTTAPPPAAFLKDFNGGGMVRTIGRFFTRPTDPTREGSSPEPGTVFLLGAGLAGVIFITRQKFRK